MSSPRAGPQEGRMLPRAGHQEGRMLPPGNTPSSQTSSSQPQTDNSAARCRVILGQQLKLRECEMFATANLQTECPQVTNSVSFHYSAMSAEARCASRAARTTVLNTEVYLRNPAVTGIHKTGSHLHYLARKIDKVISKMDLYSNVLNKDVKRLNSKVDTYVIDLYMKRRMLCSTEVLPAPNCQVDIELLNEKLAQYALDITQKMKLVKNKIYASTRDIKSDIKKLNLETAPYAQAVEKQMKRLKSQLALFANDFTRKMRLLMCKLIPCVPLKREIQLLEEGKVDIED